MAAIRRPIATYRRGDSTIRGLQYISGEVPSSAKS